MKPRSVGGLLLPHRNTPRSRRTIANPCSGAHANVAADTGHRDKMAVSADYSLF
jgi:hypothetical protein